MFILYFYANGEEYAEALTVAENQITHMQEEHPFLPEDFGFTKTVGPKEIHDNPTTIYTSKYDENISIFQNDDEECQWILLRREKDLLNNLSFISTKLLIPNHRIAYAVFFAIGIKVENEQLPEEKQETMKKEKQEMKLFCATYTGKRMLKEGEVFTGEEVAINLKAFDEEDARSRAKFVFETGDFGIKEPINFNEVTIKNQ